MGAAIEAGLQGRNSLGDKRTVDSLICGDDRCAYSQAELTSHFWQKTNEIRFGIT